MEASNIILRKIYVLAVLASLLISFSAIAYNVHPASGGGSWWDPNWHYRKSITIDHTKVSASLTNFPVLVSITDPDLASKAKSSGYDIAFTDSSQVKLDHQIEYYNSSTGQLIAWVKASLSSTSDTVLEMYYGNPTASNQQNPTGVWDSNYAMVQHLSETVKPPSGAAPWNQYAGNPILSGDTDGFGTVFYDSGVYHLYCSWGSILHYTSADGKTGWTADPLNPMLTGDNEGVPTVWKENGVWYMLYRYHGPDRIGLATSSDGSTWTRYAGNPVIPASMGAMDPWGIIKVGSTYYLWINDGFGGNGRGAELVTSTDLHSWTADINAIFSGGRYCVYPFKYGSYYYMLVPCYTTGPYGVIELYRCAYPTFHASDRQYLGNVISPGSGWTQYRFDTPCVLTDDVYRDIDTDYATGNQLWMYFSSTPDSGGKWWTGICIEQNITDALTRFGTPSPYSHFDSTANNNNGKAQGSLTMGVPGKIDGANYFNYATLDYIDCGDSNTLKGMSTLTVEAWVNLTSLPSGGTGIVSKWGSWSSGSYIMWQGSAGTVGWGVITSGYSTVTSPSALTTGQWYHLVGIYDGSQIRLYINGAQVGSASRTGTVSSDTTSCKIGRYDSVNWNGLIDEVRISNVARSASWITTEYNNQLNPSTFYTLGSQESNYYTLSFSIVGQGSVDPYPIGPYQYGDVVTLTPLPSVGWRFDHWSGGLTGYDNPGTLTIVGDTIVTATFVQNEYTLTVSKVGNGSVTLDNPGPYHYGDVVKLTAIPDPGWSFKYWTGDLSGSDNTTTIVMTSDHSVTANFAYPTLYVSPPLVERGMGDIGTSFDVQVKIADVKDLWGFDFQLNWDSTLITLTNVDYTTTLDAVWGSGNWFIAESNIGSGFYKLAAVSTQHGFNSAVDPQALVTLTFRVEDPHSNFPLQTSIHFTTHKLSDSQVNSIAHTVTNGTYSMNGSEKPTLSIAPTAKTCREYGESFTIQVDASGIFNVTDFEFEIDYNTTLLDYSNIAWNAWGTGTLTVDEQNGKITGSTSGSMLSGDQTLITIEFKAAYHHIWKNIPDWTNDQSGLIFLQAANLSYPGSLKLHYTKGGLNEINVGSDVTYTFSPIQGDIDNNGTVDVMDLRTVAAFYDQQNPAYNLTGDSTIDIYDLVVIGANFNYTYIP